VYFGLKKYQIVKAIKTVILLALFKNFGKNIKGEESHAVYAGTHDE
jgi:hypothetical protein